MNDWMIEETGGTRWGFKVSASLFSGRSGFQKIDIVETENFGRVLFIDGIAMLTERMEFIYHEMAAHVPLFVHPSPEKVLIIGGGDGGTAREVLRHAGVKTVDVVEIDSMVVEACTEYLPFTAAAFADPRLSLLITDGLEYVRTTRTRYDIVIIDSTDPAGPAEGLFGASFYENLKRCLSDGGIVVAQSESPVASPGPFVAYVRLVRDLFDVSLPYLYHTPDYPGGTWSFTFSSDVYHPLKDFDSGKYRGAGLETGYYDERIHRSAFELPNFVGKLLK